MAEPRHGHQSYFLETPVNKEKLYAQHLIATWLFKGKREMGYSNIKSQLSASIILHFFIAKPNDWSGNRARKVGLIPQIKTP